METEERRYHFYQLYKDNQLNQLIYFPRPIFSWDLKPQYLVFFMRSQGRINVTSDTIESLLSKDRYERETAKAALQIIKEYVQIHEEALVY